MNILIVVPIYNGLQTALRCLQSLRDVAASNVTAARVLVIDDASTDPAAYDALADVVVAASSGNTALTFSLRRNAINRGFTWNVNQAIASLQAGEHLLLLNSDTIVVDGWLDEICRSAQTDPMIGTVTPFSNNATICSYPDFQQAWPVPEIATHRAIAERMRSQRAAPIDIPTGVGFCMLMTRACIDQVGRYDIENFPRGYGEENDFCMRALAAGFRNVLCPNTYVAHVGGVSFSEQTKELMRQGGERLLAKHPQYNELVSHWIAADPARERREDIAKLLEQR
ncbi:MAG: glycosyltransferase [Betaproteobacteria bacterium]|nr:MAG: glycosyltransferase [Betaproteobacteria bacterium]